MTTHHSRLLPGAAADEHNISRSSAVPHARYGEPPTCCLEAALIYASLGVQVFPLTVTKSPLRRCAYCLTPGACPGRDRCHCGVNTCHGFYAATSDLETIRRWWEGHPHWQVGIRTGHQSGLVVLDVDPDKGGLASLISLQKAGLDIAGTAVQLSGSGQSFHLIYAHPGGHVPNSQSKLGAGLDVRGDGGYVVAAPSRHASTGAPYELLGDLTSLPPWPLSHAVPRRVLQGQRQSSARMTRR